MLEIINLNYEIEGRKIINNLNLKIDLSKLSIITGPNGCGKSTLLKLIMGIIQPTSGSIIFNGRDITNREPSERFSMGIAYCYQTPVTFKGFTVSYIFGLITKDEEKHVEVLRKVGLSEKYLDRELNSSLSGGEIKKIEIAMALLKKKDLLLLDEPEAGVDIWSFENLVQLFKDNKTIIVTHNKDIMNMADTIIYMNSGSVERVKTSDN